MSNSMVSLPNPITGSGIETNGDEIDLMSKLQEINEKLDETEKNLKAEMKRVKTELAEIASEKEAKTQIQTELMLGIMELRSEKDNLRMENNLYSTYHSSVCQIIQEFDKHIGDDAGLQEFENSVQNLIGGVDTAVMANQEDFLQLELLKRNQSIKEKRLDLADLDNQIHELNLKIEAKRIEEERVKRAEEERLKKEEEERRELEKVQARQQLRKQQEIRQLQKQHELEKCNQNPTMFVAEKLPISYNDSSVNKPFNFNQSSTKKMDSSISDSFKDWAGLLTW